MKKLLIVFFFLFSAALARAQNEIGPEGGKMLVILIAASALALVVFLFIKSESILATIKNSFLGGKKISIDIKKDRKYYPDILDLVIKNSGRKDVDISQPLLIFDNFWFRRKFKLKGMNNYHFYPLILEKGGTHSLRIDLNRFYRHDKSLKKYPKIRIVISEREGNKLGSKSAFLRKTLVKF